MKAKRGLWIKGWVVMLAAGFCAPAAIAKDNFKLISAVPDDVFLCVAAQHNLAFAALRVVVDPAHRTVPPAALIEMRPDGRPNVPAMLRNIAARPSQLSRLARIAVDAFTARAAMNRVRRSIGPHFGLMDH